MLLSNVFSNRLNDLVDNSDKENIISCRQTRNKTSPQLSNTGRNRVIGHFEIEKGAIKRNKVVRYSKKGEEMEGVNADMSKIGFLDQGITKCN